MDIAGKRILLTGATGGLGRALAVRLADRDVELVLVGRKRAALDEQLGALPAGNHQSVLADIASVDGRRAVVDAVGGSLDGLINCAGVNTFGLFADQCADDLERLLRVNVIAAVELIRDLLPVLGQRKSLVVNVGSTFGTIGYPGYTAYCASKFALRGFTEALARELADSSVRVCYFAPRAIRTPMNDANIEAMNAELGNTMDTPERVADSLVKFLEQGRARRHVGWPERLFVTLNALLPGIVDGALAKNLPVIQRHCRGDGASSLSPPG
ncbi:SDR family oxidoreductase [Parahaliea mediterranea]|uniref:SDR family oxidoreductase n=1 Tax=Parahaliea mediterranea TaxID=651086 RepID=A0A939DH02_9GAMM|nr:SDR family oxidoreductase [Parahaliea mediterranea]